MNHSALSLSSIFLIIFFQNCWSLFAKYSSKCIFISFTNGIVIYYGENFLITGKVIIKARSGEYRRCDKTSQSNSFSLTINTTCGFALSWWPHQFTNFGFSAMASFNLSSWLQYFSKLMVSSSERNS